MNSIIVNIMTNYWIKDQTRSEIITKTQIPNKGNFSLFATYFNLIDVKGLGLQLSCNKGFEVEKLYRKGGFEYLVLEHNNQKELFILPNKNIEILTEKIVSKINDCNRESDVVNLVLDEMN